MTIEYDQDYFETSNYKHYTTGRYRIYHWVRFFIIGFMLKVSGTKTVLDFGCADGISVAAFRKFNLDASGVDVSEYATSKAPGSTKKFITCAQDSYLENFKDKQFDYITAFDVIEHLEPKDLDKIFREFSRIAKKGLFEIYVLDEAVAKYQQMIGKLHPDHLSEHGSDWWRAYFEKQGYKYKKVPFYRKGAFVIDFSGQPKCAGTPVSFLSNFSTK